MQWLVQNRADALSLPSLWPEGLAGAMGQWIGQHHHADDWHSKHMGWKSWQRMDPFPMGS
eukprot:5886501-Karenia_brevis.AAC.1